MKYCPRAVSIARPSTLQLTALPSEVAAAPSKGDWCHNVSVWFQVVIEGHSLREGLFCVTMLFSIFAKHQSRYIRPRSKMNCQPKGFVWTMYWCHRRQFHFFPQLADTKSQGFRAVSLVYRWICWSCVQWLLWADEGKDTIIPMVLVSPLNTQTTKASL